MDLLNWLVNFFPGESEEVTKGNMQFYFCIQKYKKILVYLFIPFQAEFPCD